MLDEKVKIRISTSQTPRNWCEIFKALRKKKDNFSQQDAIWVVLVWLFKSQCMTRIHFHDRKYRYLKLTPKRSGLFWWCTTEVFIEIPRLQPRSGSFSYFVLTNATMRMKFVTIDTFSENWPMSFVREINVHSFSRPISAQTSSAFCS